MKAGTDKVDYIAVLYDIEPYFKQLVQLIKSFGHIGTIVGTKSELPMTLLKNLAVRFSWERMFVKSDYSFNTVSQGEILNRIATLLDSKKIPNGFRFQKATIPELTLQISKQRQRIY